MTFDEYQKFTETTKVYGKNIEPSFVYPTLGLVGEAGEVAEKVKKILRDERGVLSDEKKQELIKEIGDVVWYIARLAAELGVTFEEVVQTNVAKLQSRLNRGTLHGNGDNR